MNSNNFDAYYQDGEMLQDISILQINLPTHYAQNHRSELNAFFKGYESAVENQYNNLIENNKYFGSRFKFNLTGSIVLNKSDLLDIEWQTLQKLNTSYFGFPYFTQLSSGSIISRGPVYYISGLIGGATFIKFLSFLEVSLDFLEYSLSILEIHSLVNLILLDEIRYKSLILFDLMLDANNGLCSKAEIIAGRFVSHYYKLLSTGIIDISFILQSIVKFRELLKLINSTSDINYLESCKLRAYKEADIPMDNLLWTAKIISSLKHTVDTVIGIRFGGIELPFLVRDHVQNNTTLQFAKVSMYSDSVSEIRISEDLIRNKNILIVDDNILTARTLNEVIKKIKTFHPKNILFTCVSYSGMKRYHHMIMPEHGLANPLLLERSCILKESSYVAIQNSDSYKNSKGVFDKIKAHIQNRLNKHPFEYKI